MVKVILFGCNGHMGLEVQKAIDANEEYKIVCGVDMNPLATSTFPQVSNVQDFHESADVIVDFSSHKAVVSILAYAKEREIPVVLCSTGYTEDEITVIEKVSKIIPIFLSSNMSRAVNLMSILSQIATNVLKDYDIEIVEKHHNRKVDAPSGTALLLANSIKAVRKELYPVCDRSGSTKPRDKNELGISSIRGGNLCGEHEVMFIGNDETLTITHTANSRSIFAKGALSACEYLIGKSPKVYTMHDLLGDEVQHL